MHTLTVLPLLTLLIRPPLTVAWPSCGSTLLGMFQCFISPTTNSSVSNDRLIHSSLSHHWKHLSMSLASYSTWTESHAKGEKDWIPMFVEVVSFMTSNYDLSIRLMPVGHRLNWSARIVGTGACMRVCQSVSIWSSLVMWKRPFHLWELMQLEVIRYRSHPRPEHRSTPTWMKCHHHIHHHLQHLHPHQRKT
jgi:hypothetical protein